MISPCKSRNSSAVVNFLVHENCSYFHTSPLSANTKFHPDTFMILCCKLFECIKCCHLWKVDEKEFHVMIKHYILKAKTAQESRAKVDKYDESVPLWFGYFLSFHMSTKDTEYSRLPGSYNSENVAKVNYLLIEDWNHIRLLRQLAYQMNKWIYFIQIFACVKIIQMWST